MKSFQGDLFFLYRCAEVLFRETKLPINYNSNPTSSYHRRYLPHQYHPSQRLDEPVPITSYPSAAMQSIPNASSSSSATSTFANVAHTVMDSFSKRRQKSRSYRSQTLKKILFHNNESPL
jgi:hypothetical protein